MWVAVDKGVRCQRCDAPLTELGWVACLRCLYASPPQIRGFDIGDELGRGGMGVVYRARQRDLDRDVALKVLDPELAGDPELRARFAREARLLARLAHPNIVAIFDAGVTDDGCCYVAMELVDGAPITACEPARALSLVAQLCDALAVAHRAGIVHRDIKPSNVLVRGARVKLVDFGIAALAHATTMLTVHGQHVGTPAFMAPEAWTGAPAQPAMDVYGVALLLHNITRGHVLPARVAAVVERALAHDPQRRPTIVELRDAIRPRRPRRAPRVLRAVLAGVAIAAVTRVELDRAGAAGSPPVASRALAASAPASAPASAAAPAPASATATATAAGSAAAPAAGSVAASRARVRTRVKALPAPATLVIRATPWALVSIDGTPEFRAEPPAETVTVVAGHHVVEASNPASHRRERVVIDVVPGETRTLTIGLEQTP